MAQGDRLPPLKNRPHAVIDSVLPFVFVFGEPLISVKGKRCYENFRVIARGGIVCLCGLNMNLCLQFVDVCIHLHQLGKGCQKFVVGRGGQALLRNIESEEVGSAVIRLSEAGGKKGNNRQRLQDALEVMRFHLENSRKDEIKARLNDDDTEALREITEILTSRGRKNQRNPGMTAI